MSGTILERDAVTNSLEVRVSQGNVLQYTSQSNTYSNAVSIGSRVN